MCSLLIIMNWTLMTVLTVLCCSTCLIFEHLLFPSCSVFVAQLCPPLCDPIDCSLQGPSVHGILLCPWVAISYSTDLPNPAIEPPSPALQEDSSPAEPPRKPCSHTCLKLTPCFSKDELHFVLPKLLALFLLNSFVPNLPLNIPLPPLDIQVTKISGHKLFNFIVYPPVVFFLMN